MSPKFNSASSRGAQRSGNTNRTRSVRRRDSSIDSSYRTDGNSHRKASSKKQYSRTARHVDCSQTVQIVKPNKSQVHGGGNGPNAKKKQTVAPHKPLQLQESYRGIKRVHADQLMEMEDLNQALPTKLLNLLVTNRYKSPPVIDLFSFLELVAGGPMGTRSASYSGGKRALPGLLRWNNSTVFDIDTKDFKPDNILQWLEHIASPLACRALLHALKLVQTGMGAQREEGAASITLDKLIAKDYQGRIHFVQMVSFSVEHFAGSVSWRGTSKAYIENALIMTNDAFAELCFNEDCRIDA
jgi:hypothetical protein